MRAEIINSKLGKTINIDNIINIYDNASTFDKSLTIITPMNGTDSAENLFNSLSFPIEKIVVYDNVTTKNSENVEEAHEEKKKEYTEYHTIESFLNNLSIGGMYNVNSTTSYRFI